MSVAGSKSANNLSLHAGNTVSKTA